MKPPHNRRSRKEAEIRRPVESWHGGGDVEIHHYALSLHNAARRLISALEQNPKTSTSYDICPVVLLYRQALEIHLKRLVGEGSNFLPSPTDPISLTTTHSLRWLAQIVGRINKAIGWESDFMCEGVSSLAEFNALVNEIEAFDPVARAIVSAGSSKSVAEYYEAFDIFHFALKLDALLDLLDSTTEALAAEWEQRAGASTDDDFGSGDFGSTIQ